MSFSIKNENEQKEVNKKMIQDDLVPNIKSVVDCESQKVKQQINYNIKKIDIFQDAETRNQDKIKQSKNHNN